MSILSILSKVLSLSKNNCQVIVLIEASNKLPPSFSNAFKRVGPASEIASLRNSLAFALNANYCKLIIYL